MLAVLLSVLSAWRRTAAPGTGLDWTKLLDTARADRVAWELEIEVEVEVDGDKTEIEIAIGRRDDPAAESTADTPGAPAVATKPAPHGRACTRPAK
ncbi:hypothetical protein ACIBEK_07280 [Nocardia fusca]|uniref:hypothetical protein n=1 Tax=Nocardia fusca TaxID=941183 RepID=UPI0037B107B1